jgi:hypothetical protein
MHGRGKKSAWLTWDSYPQLTAALLDLHTVSDNIGESTLSTLERFVVLLYDRTSDCLKLDVARKQMFTKKCRTLEALPPTSDAFAQHVK